MSRWREKIGKTKRKEKWGRKGDSNTGVERQREGVDHADNLSPCTRGYNSINSYPKVMYLTLVE